MTCTEWANGSFPTPVSPKSRTGDVPQLEFIQPHAHRAFDLLVDHVENGASLPPGQCVPRGAMISAVPTEPGHCATLFVPWTGVVGKGPVVGPRPKGGAFVRVKDGFAFIAGYTDPNFGAICRVMGRLATITAMSIKSTLASARGAWPS